MNTIGPSITLLLLITVLGCGPQTERAMPDAEAAPSMQTPDWLAGCWLMARGDFTIEERWMPNRGGTLLGVSRTMRGERLTGYEWVLLRADSTDWVFEAHPSGQESAQFRSTAITDTSIEFANPDHDFPQTISYFRVGADSLLGQIGGLQGGQLQEIGFPYARVSCAPGASADR